MRHDVAHPALPGSHFTPDLLTCNEPVVHQVLGEGGRRRCEHHADGADECPRNRHLPVAEHAEKGPVHEPREHHEGGVRVHYGGAVRVREPHAREGLLEYQAEALDDGDDDQLERERERWGGGRFFEIQGGELVKDCF